MIQLRPYVDTDYPMLLEWWAGHSWPSIPASVLPALGMIAENDGNPVAAAWCYLDNSRPVGFMEWIVTNPANSPRLSAQALCHVISGLQAAAKQIGYQAIFTSCRQESLARLLERSGFVRTDSDVIHLLSITS